MENKSNRQWTYIIIAVLIVAIILLFLPVNIQRTVSFTGKILPSKSLIVYYDSDGRLVSEYINNDKHIKQKNIITFDRGDNFNIEAAESFGFGDTLLTISSIEVEREIVELRTQLNELEYTKKALLAGDKPEKINELKNNLIIARQEYENLNKIFRRADSLFAKELISEEEYENIKTQRDIAQLHTKAVEYQLKYAETGARKQDIELIEAKIQAVKDKLEILNKKQDGYIITNPFNNAISISGASSDTLFYLSEAGSYIIYFPLLATDAELINSNTVGFFYSANGDSIRIKIESISNNVKMLNNKPVKICNAKVMEQPTTGLEIGEFVKGSLYAGDERISDYLLRGIH